MSLETKALSDFQNVISCEMDLQDALAGGSLDGYAIRDTNLSRTSFENRMLKNVLIHRTSMPSLRMDSMDANAIQCTACNLRGCSMRDANIDGWNMLNCHAIECRFEDTLLQNGNFFESDLVNCNFNRYTAYIYAGYDPNSWKK